MPRLPSSIAALLDALRFPESQPRTIPPFDDAEWAKMLAFCDQAQLTLALARRAPQGIPDWVRERLVKNVTDNTQRVETIRREYAGIEAVLKHAGVEHLVLKGFGHYPDFTDDLRFRPQYDLDLFCREDQVFKARDAVLGLGFLPIEWSEELPADHLPTMIRKTGWRWRGDYFDPEIPIAVELHYRFWDPATERFGPSNLSRFWTRRQDTGMDRVDALTYACLHLLKHLFRGEMRPFRVYEIAWFLEHAASDEAFWQRWDASNEDGLEPLQAICFRLASDWFGCRLSREARQAVDRLPAEIRRWFDDYGNAPLEALFHPNKDELWLHLTLVAKASDRWALVRRRLLPGTLPTPVDAVHAADTSLGGWLAIYTRYAGHLVARAFFHARVLIPSLWHGLRWAMQRPATEPRA